MKSLASEILSSRKVEGPNGEQYQLEANIDAGLGELLQQIIAEIRPKHTLEIGLAYGISSLYICEQLQAVGAESHTILDPYQERIYHGAGLHQLMKCGYGSLVKFSDDHPHVYLPRLLQERGQHLDFCFQDGPKRFDLAMVNTFYLSEMLKPNGIMFFDDVNAFPSIRKLCRFMAKQPNYEVFRPYRGTGQLKLKQRVGRPMRKTICQTIGALPVVSSALSPAVYQDPALNIDAGAVGFRKISNDPVKWNFFKDF